MYCFKGEIHSLARAGSTWSKLDIKKKVGKVDRDVAGKALEL